jgi:uncharacterized protein YbcI
MGDEELHREGAADVQESREGPNGALRQDISNEIVRLYKDHFGKGPTRCRTYLQPELVIVVLGEGYTAAEQTLFEGGKWYEVRQARQIWQDTMRERFVETIERLTGGSVIAFMSANHQDPDLAVEMFVLDAEQTSLSK